MNFNPILACIAVLMGFIFKLSFIIWLFTPNAIFEPPIKISLGDVVLTNNESLSICANSIDCEDLGEGGVKIPIKHIAKNAKQKYKKFLAKSFITIY